MTTINGKHLVYFFLCLTVFYAFSSSHPVSGSGYTGAPGDGVCAQCHSGSNSALTGDVFIEGVPTTLDPGTTVPLTVRVTNPAMNASRAGFQLTALDQNDDPIGNIVNIGSAASLKTAGGQEYVGHQPAVNFSAGEATWMFDFQVPSNLGGATQITFYSGAIIANGGNGNSNDRFVLTSETAPLNVGVNPLTVSITSSSDSPCADIDGGSASADAMGGASPYSFLWSNGETGPNAVALPPGQISSVTVTDNANNTASDNVAIGAPPLLELDIISQTPAPCDGLTGGSATVAASGGAGSYTYQWPGGLTGPVQPALNVGTYEVTATDGNNCEATNTVIISAIPVLSIDTTIVNVSCNGGMDGSIDLSVSGGTPPYVFTWNDGMTTEDRSNLPAGNYTVTILDDNACSLIETYTVTQPGDISLTGDIVDVTCFGFDDGVIAVTVVGGTGSYNYAWSNGATTAQVSNLIAGTYDVTVTDSNGCSETDSYSVDQPGDIMITVLDTEDVSCAGGSDGFVSITVSGGGTSPFSFSWSDGGDGTGLSTGNYTVTVSDANNCTTERSFFIGQQAQPLVVAVTTTSVSTAGAADGSATAFVVGGVTPYSYLWNTMDTTVSLIDLTSGNYSVTVTDSLGCTAMSEGFVGAGDCLLNASAVVNQNTCQGDSLASITITVNNAVGMPTYEWSTGDSTSTILDLPAGLYNVTITDDSDCTFTLRSIEVSDPPNIAPEVTEVTSLQCVGGEAILSYSVANVLALDSVAWSTGETGDSILIMLPGIYTLTAVDTLGCIETDSIVVIGQDTLAPQITFSNAPSWYIGSDGFLTIDTSSVLVSIVDDCTIDSSAFVLRVDSVLNCDLVGQTLIADVYARDSQGNIAIDSVEILVLDTLAPVITQAIDTIVIGNCDTVTYSAPTFMDNCSMVSIDLDSSLLGSLLDLGDYSIAVTATDGSGNETSTSLVLSIVPSLDISATIQDISCNGEGDGSFTVDSIVGYEGPFTVTIEGAIVPVGLEAGVYAYTVTDSVGCAVSDSFEILEPAPLMLDTFVINDASDSTARNGSLGIQVVGGTGRITYSWTNAAGEVISTNSFAAGLQAGEYMVAIMDANDCLLVETFVVGYPGSTAVNELPKDAWSAYPNPARDRIFVAGIEGSYKMECIATDGRLYYSGTHIDKTIDIDVSDWPSGLYAVRIVTESGLYGQRTIIVTH